MNPIVREDCERILDELEPDLARLGGTTLLVTGAGGFLCSYFLDLVALYNDRRPGAPCRVIAVDNFQSGAPARVAHLASRPEFRFVRADLAQPFSIDERVDWILHGAGIASPPIYRRFPLETIDVAVVGTRSMLDLALRDGSAAMVLFSSSEIYGDPDPAFIPTPETYRGSVSCTGPRACYDESKRLAETLVTTYHRLHGLPVKIVRPFNVYGPGLRLDDGRIIPDMARASLEGRPFVLHSDGRATRAFCYIADAIRGVMTVLFHGAPGEAYNVGNDEAETPIGALAETMRAIVGGGPVEYRPSGDPDYLTDNPQRRCPDLGRLRALSGWRPTVGLREGLERTLASYRAAGAPPAQAPATVGPLKVTVVGTGYVGLVTGVCLAAVGHEVVCVDLLAERVQAINAGRTPIHEAGLELLLAEALASGRFRVTTELGEALAGSDLSLIAVGTPTLDGRIDLTAVRQAAEQIGRLLPTLGRYHVVAVKSTVVPGTTAGVVGEAVARASGLPAGKWGLAMNPEFLREGTAVEDFMHPDRIVIGQSDDRAGRVLERLYAPFDCPKIRTTLANAEMIKYASNTLLATLVSFSNELATLCERLPDTDAAGVFEALHMDRRLSPSVDGRRVTPAITTYLKPGVGFGGSCLPKDVNALRALARDCGIETPVLDAAIAVNDRRPASVVGLLEEVVGPLRGRTVTILGLAFKPGTDDLRDSPALRLAECLVAGGAEVRGYDPIAAGAALRAGWPLAIASSPEEAFDGADAVLLATAWPEFERWDWPALVVRMRQPLVFDGRRMLDPSALPGQATYRTIGRPAERLKEITF